MDEYIGRILILAPELQIKLVKLNQLKLEIKNILNMSLWKKINTKEFFESDCKFDVSYAILATKEEENNFYLDKAKENKKQQLKAIRDEKNIDPLTNCTAKILNDNGTLGADTGFLFYANRHPSNPASDPNAILTACIMFNQTIPYSTRDLEGNKICIALTPAIAKTISVNLVKRNGENYKQYDNLAALVNQAKTETDINNIDWI
jgi:hypothetical protein